MHSVRLRVRACGRRADAGAGRNPRQRRPRVRPARRLAACRPRVRPRMQAQRNRLFPHGRRGRDGPAAGARDARWSGAGRNTRSSSRKSRCGEQATTRWTWLFRRSKCPTGWRGWLSGDVHVHMNYGGTYRATPETLRAQARAEDLDVVFNLVVNKEQRIPDIAPFLDGAGRRLGRGHADPAPAGVPHERLGTSRTDRPREPPAAFPTTSPIRTRLRRACIRTT